MDLRKEIIIYLQIEEVYHTREEIKNNTGNYYEDLDKVLINYYMKRLLNLKMVGMDLLKLKKINLNPSVYNLVYFIYHIFK